MKKKYVYQIEEIDSYPFQGAKQPNLSFVVMVNLSKQAIEKKSCSQASAVLILSLEHPSLMQIQQVLEKKNGGFQFLYEYVGDCLKNSAKMNQTSYLSRVKSKLVKLAEFLIQNRVKTDFRIEDIGISQEGQPKYFLRPCFEIASESENENLATEYQTQLDRLFECSLNLRETIKSVSDYSCRLDKKLSQIQKRIKKLKRRSGRGNYLQSVSLKTEDRNRTPSDQSSNEKDQGQSMDKLRTENNIVLKHLTDKQGGNLQKLTNSFMGPDSNRIKLKYHKSSFGDYSTTSHHLNEQIGKEATLKTRVSTALEKTQQAFKFYEKYYKRRGRI